MFKNPFKKKKQPESALPSSSTLTAKVPFIPNQSSAYSQHLIQQAQMQQDLAQQMQHQHHLAAHQSMLQAQQVIYQGYSSLSQMQSQQQYAMQQNIFARYVEATFDVDVFFLYSDNKLLYCDWDRTKLMKLGKKLGGYYKITSLEIEYQKSRRGL